MQLRNVRYTVNCSIDNKRAVDCNSSVFESLFSSSITTLLTFPKSPVQY